MNDRHAGPRALTRREALLQLLGTAGAGMTFLNTLAAHPIHDHMANHAHMAMAQSEIEAANWAPKFLAPHQNETLIVLAELIVPNSKKAKVNRLIDLLLSVDTELHQKQFVGALAAIDHESLKRYRRPFTRASAEQQDQLLIDASKSLQDDPGPGGGKSPAGNRSPHTPGKAATLHDHFEELKRWTTGTFYSSEIGMRELGWTGDYFFDTYPGCEHPEEHS